MENRKSSVHAHKGMRRGPVAAAAAALLAAAWFYSRTAPARVSTALPAATPAALDVARRVEPAPSMAPASFAALPTASAVQARASGPYLPPVESPAESLRKVQFALAGGTPQDAWSAALTLESCVHADMMANALMQNRETMTAQMPPEVKKAFEGLPPVSSADIERARSDQRRCQVFDPATLARRGELYQKAYEGGADGAALTYLGWLNSEDGPKDKADPALVARLQAAVRKDAMAAEFTTLGAFVFGGGFTAAQAAASPVEAQAYKEAYLRIADETSPGGSASTRALVAKLSFFVAKPPVLTPEQQSQADALTSQVMDAWHRRMHKGG